MFGDLDWPINASRRFVSISWASCFYTQYDSSKLYRRVFVKWQPGGLNAIESSSFSHRRPTASSCEESQSWLVSALQRLTWCEVLLRLPPAVDVPFEPCFLTAPSGHPGTAWRDGGGGGGNNGDRKSSPWQPAGGTRSSPLCRQTAAADDGGERLRESCCSDDSGAAALRPRASSSTRRSVQAESFSSSLSSSYSSWVVSAPARSTCRSPLTGDWAGDSSCSSSALARLYLVRRFWNQTFTCTVQPCQTIN